MMLSAIDDHSSGCGINKPDATVERESGPTAQEWNDSERLQMRTNFVECISARANHEFDLGISDHERRCQHHRVSTGLPRHPARWVEEEAAAERRTEHPIGHLFLGRKGDPRRFVLDEFDSPEQS